MKRELTVIGREFMFGSNYGNFYLKDDEGNCYYWYTASNRTYEKMEEGTKHLCSFVVTVSKWEDERYGEVTTIKNVRF